MAAGKLIKIGDSYGVIVPSLIRREANWWPGDTLLIEPTEDGILLRNTTQHDVKPTLTRKQYGDGRVDRP